MDHRQPFLPNNTTMPLDPTFIVGTGRCGSTMLSNLLSEHPALLSVSELFSFVSDLMRLIPSLFDDNIVDADTFWSILSTPKPIQMFAMRKGIKVGEILYPLHEGARFTLDSGVPPIMWITLPLLSREPEHLYDEIDAFLHTLPAASKQVFFVTLLDWLTQKFGKRAWVERSAGSIGWVTHYQKFFPNAKYIHLLRDGRDCAISMSKHEMFRFVLLWRDITTTLGYDPLGTNDRTGIEKLSGHTRRFLPEHFEKREFDQIQFPLASFGSRWSGYLLYGMPQLAAIPAERVLTIWYDDILAEPEIELRKMVAFMSPELVDENWIRHAAARVRPARSSWKTLAADELRALESGCRSGCEAIGISPYQTA